MCSDIYIYIYETENSLFLENHIGGVMVSMLALSAVDCEFQPRSLQIKDYKIGICFFFAKHAALKRQSKDWLGRHIYLRTVVSVS